MNVSSHDILTLHELLIVIQLIDCIYTLHVKVWFCTTKQIYTKTHLCICRTTASKIQ